jgi:SET domain-containing protein
LGGTGVFAVELIFAGEPIASFDGPFYPWDYPDWTPDLLHHAIQCGRTRFRDSAGIARYVNHSCEPNCGIRGLFDIVAMRTIEPGEEVTWDYEMTEDSDWWRMECRCGTPSCRKVIGSFRNMPSEVRAKYRGFISAWLISNSNRPSLDEELERCAAGVKLTRSLG